MTEEPPFQMGDKVTWSEHATPFWRDMFGTGPFIVVGFPTRHGETFVSIRRADRPLGRIRAMFLPTSLRKVEP